MYINANFWPVWKNTYQDYHKKNNNIPEDVKKLTTEEEEKKNYRSACQRCFIYLKKNVKEEIPEDMIDYMKGARIVIIEEFLFTLSRLPELYHIPFTILEYVFKYTLNVVEFLFKYLEIF